MSGYILCQVKKAKKPYFIENISTNIYSIEELCFYLCRNLYLIDHTIRNEEMAKWLEDELGLRSLAAKVRPYLKESHPLSEFLYPILKEINYLGYEELKTLNAQLQKMEEEPVIVQKKKKADCLVMGGMYVNAIQNYQEVLSRDDGQKPDFTAAVLHNLGCSYGYLFQKEDAAECFWKSYEKSHSMDELDIYLAAYCDWKGENACEKRIKELRLEASEGRRIIEKFRKARRQAQKTEVQEKDMDSLLERLTAEYHRSTSA